MKSAKIQLLKPSMDGADLRANVIFKAGDIAEQIREMSSSYQMDPASVIRMLVVEGLKKRAG